MLCDGPARTDAPDILCTSATTALSTVPMGPPTCVDGPAPAVDHAMWCTTSIGTTTTLFGCAWVVIRQKQL